jgi:cell division transport system ATP-binding protein
MVFQDFKLINDKTVYENIAFAMEISGRPDNEIKKDVKHVLDLVNLLDKKHFFPKELSGGEKQMLAIARAVVNNPDIILADEPTATLDEESTKSVIEILKKINSFGTTILLATHDKEVVKLIGGRNIKMNDGEIISDTLKNKNNL